MPKGVPINRQCVYTLKDGTPILDWDNGLVQDLISGDFRHDKPTDVSHAIQDNELDTLIRFGRVDSYDKHWVYVLSLPERSLHTLE